MTLTQKLSLAQQSIDGKIAEFCRVQSINSEQFANLIGIHKNSLSNKRKGKTEWRQTELIALCDLLGCSQDELVGFDK